jgi:membrane-bound hydrogenase subunit mbhJ
MDFIKKSPWIYHLNTGGCNGCDLEVIACLTPRFDIERFGCVMKGSPRHADILLVSGIVTRKTLDRVKRVYAQMPKKKIVIALGSCGITGGIFKEGYNEAGPIDRIIPVDMYIPGCPPRPEAIIYGIKKALERLE